MGIEFVGFRIWSTHIKLRKKTAKKLKRRLKYMFAAYHAGEIDKDTLDRSVASYRGHIAALQQLRYAPEPKRTVLARNGQAISRTGEEASQQMRSILRILRQH